MNTKKYHRPSQNVLFSFEKARKVTGMCLYFSGVHGLDTPAPKIKTTHYFCLTTYTTTDHKSCPNCAVYKTTDASLQRWHDSVVSVIMLVCLLKTVSAV